MLTILAYLFLFYIGCGVICTLELRKLLGQTTREEFGEYMRSKGHSEEDVQDSMVLFESTKFRLALLAITVLIWPYFLKVVYS